MKTSVQLYQPTEAGSAVIPAELANMREYALTFIVGFMRMFGIGKLGVKPAFVGIKSVADITFAPLMPGVPIPLAASRNYLVRQLADIAVLFGILSVEINPTDEEKEDIKVRWQNLATGAKPSSDSPAIDEIKLNIESDPTGQSVIDNDKSKDDTAGTQQASESGEG